MVRRLAQGGMGELYLVEHRETGALAVAKLLHEALMRDAQFVDRLRVEAQSLGRLEHENVVEIALFLKTQSGRPFFVMPYLIGRSLDVALAEHGALPLLDAIDFAHQALKGLGAAHAIGIVHRDVKPSNLFLSEEEVDGKTTVTLKVLDFGLARVLPGASERAPRPLALPTETGAVLGTPRYLSPEAALGKRVDHRADLYCVALVLYEMLAGRGPFDHLQHDFLTAHNVEEPLPPSYYAQRPIPVELDKAVLLGLAKNPADRYQTAEEFQTDLEQIFRMLLQSQGLKTTIYAASPKTQTTGDLWRQHAPPASEHPAPATEQNGRGEMPARVAGAAEPSAHVQAPASRAVQRASPVLLAATVLVAVVTAVVLTLAGIALLSRFAP